MAEQLLESGTKEIRFRQAIATALADEMRADKSVMIFGEDVAVADGEIDEVSSLLNEW